MSRPGSNTYPPYFNTYIKLVEEENINNALKDQLPVAEEFLNSITEEQSFYKYAEGKWSIKEVLQHIIDAERVFVYRAMAFARQEQNLLPSFDENEYAANSHADDRPWKELTGELVALRKSTIFFFDSLSEEDFNTIGKASNYEISVLALAYVTVGHLTHHLNLIKERYVSQAV